MKALRHIGIVCSDVRKMVEFYSFIFGAPKKTTVAVERGNFITHILRGAPLGRGESPIKEPAFVRNEVILQTTKVCYGDGSVLEFLHYIQPAPLKALIPTPIKMGFSHLSVSVPQIGTLYSGLRATAKGTFISSPQLNEDKTALVCFIIDPEGNCVELVEELRDAKAK